MKDIAKYINDKYDFGFEPVNINKLNKEVSSMIEIDKYFDKLSELHSIPPVDEYCFYKQLCNREIWIDSDIETENGTLSIIKRIIHYNREDFGIPVDDREPIIIYFFCFGGDLHICRALIDAIESSTTPVYGVNLGVCFSAAAYIFLSCHKRLMLKNSKFLFHKGSGEFSGDYGVMKSAIDEYNKMVAQLSEILEKYTTYDRDVIESRINNEWYIDSDEAVENHVVNKVVDSIDEII